MVGYHASHPGQIATHSLRDTVQNNIGEIRAAQEKYLAEISKTIDIANGKVMKEDEAEEDD